MSQAIQCKFELRLLNDLVFRVEDDGKSFSLRQNGKRARIYCPVLPFVIWIRWAVGVLGSDYCRLRHPELYVPINWLGENPSLEAVERMRDNIARARKHDGLNDYYRMFIKYNLPIRRGNLTFKFDGPGGGYRFVSDTGPPIFCFELAAEFAACILRDLAVRDFDSRYYVPWLPTRGQKAWLGDSLNNAVIENSPFETNRTAAFTLLRPRPHAQLMQPLDRKTALATLIVKCQRFLTAEIEHLPQELRLAAEFLRSSCDLFSKGLRQKGYAPADSEVDLTEEKLAVIRQNLEQAKAQFEIIVAAHKARIEEELREKFASLADQSQETAKAKQLTEELELKAKKLDELEAQLRLQLSALGDKDKLVDAEKELRKRAETQLEEAKLEVTLLEEHIEQLNQRISDLQAELSKAGSVLPSSGSLIQQAKSKLAQARGRRNSR